MGSYLKYLPTITGNYSSSSNGDKKNNTSSGNFKKYADIVTKFQPAPTLPITTPSPALENSKPNQSFDYLSSIKESLAQGFPETVNAVKGITAPTNFKNILSDTWNAIKDPAINYFNQIKASTQMDKQTPKAEVVAQSLKNVVGAASVIFTPINAAMAAGNDIPVISFLTRLLSVPFVTIGEATRIDSDMLMDQLPLSQKDKETLKPAVGDTLALISQIAMGKLIDIEAKKVKPVIQKLGQDTFTKLTKDITTEYKIPETISINKDVVKRFFINDKELDPNIRKALIDLDIPQSQLKTAVTQGVTIDLPWQKIIKINDKPYWGKVKSIFNVPSNEISSITNLEKPTVGVKISGALPEGKITPATPVILPKETISKIRGEPLIPKTLENYSPSLVTIKNSSGGNDVYVATPDLINKLKVIDSSSDATKYGFHLNAPGTSGDLQGNIDRFTKQGYVYKGEFNPSLLPPELSKIADLNRSFSESNTKKISSDTLAGSREDQRIDTPQNIDIVKSHNKDVILENPTAETQVIISRAGTEEIKPGDHVVFGEKGAERYLAQRENSKIFTKSVPLKDLVRSNGVGSEVIYSPKEKITPKISPTTQASIENVKTIKDVQTSLKNIKNEFDSLKTEAEGIATVAQEQRTGLNTANIAKLKRIYKRSQKFQEGDIETIRSSNTGPLLDKVLEDVMIKYPEMDEQEAFDFAINLPNKSLESIKRSPEIKKLVDKQKVLNKYLDSLTEKQKLLKLNQENEAYQEWQDVLASQEQLEKTIGVPRSQLPVGEGAEKVSKLEARVKNTLDNINQETIDKLGLSTYNELSKKENIAAAAKYALENPDDAIKVLSGEMEAPKGILRNAIYVAMQNQAIGNVDLAMKLASITSTRLGQEIGILTEIDPNSPVKAISDIIKIREETFKKKYPGQSTKQVKDKIVKDIKNEVKKPSKYDWESFINSIKC
ncbi:MAG: hypothetical protein PHO75_02480 [Candidatus Shapirobacteria bacterium]|nr:hypothetical protein [Candidatus Shapirobacteria bacterium]